MTRTYFMYDLESFLCRKHAGEQMDLIRDHEANEGKSI
jgi:hypothetical protein